MTESSVIFGDCVEIIELLDDNSIDCCLTDPPYGIDFQSARRTDRSLWKPKIQNDSEPFTDWIAPLYRKMKDGGRLLCFYRWDVQDAFLDEIVSAGFTVKSQIVWDKRVHGMGDLRGEFAPQHELIMYATKGRYEFPDKRPTTVYRSQRCDPQKMIHPNEKPVGLLKDLINDITSERELIFDPFGGSFSTYVASISLNRRCITCELDEYYYKLGKDRVVSLNDVTNYF